MLPPLRLQLFVASLILIGCSDPGSTSGISLPAPTEVGTMSSDSIETKWNHIDEEVSRQLAMKLEPTYRMGLMTFLAAARRMRNSPSPGTASFSVSDGTVLTAEEVEALLAPTRRLSANISFQPLTAKSLDIRFGASISAPIVAVVPPGSEVKIPFALISLYSNALSNPLRISGSVSVQDRSTSATFPGFNVNESLTPVPVGGVQFPLKYETLRSASMNRLSCADIAANMTATAPTALRLDVSQAFAINSYRGAETDEQCRCAASGGGSGDPIEVIRDPGYGLSAGPQNLESTGASVVDGTCNDGQDTNLTCRLEYLVIEISRDGGPWEVLWQGYVRVCTTT